MPVAFWKTVMFTMIAVTITGLFLALSTVGVLAAPRGSGRLRVMNVGVYSDSSCSVACESLSWGNINSGGVATKAVYIKNLGSAAVALRMSVSDWSPRKAASVVDLSWDLDGYLLRVGEVVPAVLILELASNTGDLRDFSFVVVITGTQQKR